MICTTRPFSISNWAEISRSSLLVLHSCTTRIDELCKSMQNWWWPACSPTCKVFILVLGVSHQTDCKIHAKTLETGIWVSTLPWPVSFRSTKVLIVQVVFSPIYCNVSTWSTTNLTASAFQSSELILLSFIHNVVSFAGLHPALTVRCANPCKTDQVDGIWSVKWKNERHSALPWCICIHCFGVCMHKLSIPSYTGGDL